MSIDKETRDNNSKDLKRGADERAVKVHDYLVSKSYRPVPALDKLQEVSKTICSAVHATFICNVLGRAWVTNTSDGINLPDWWDGEQNALNAY